MGCFFSSISQHENDVWYFGDYAGITFSSNPPTSLSNGSLSTQEGCSSVASASGSLLFYTDGTTIYDQTHAVMANGTGLTGNFSTTQAALIIKQPGNTNLFYVFTLGCSGYASLDYSIVDMTLASGNGSVITKNVPVYASCDEKLTAVKHCNGVDIWVLYHESGNSNFKAHLLTAAGFGTTAVTSAIGTASVALGQMKVSPNGRKLVNVLCSKQTCELFDFDSSTGVISNSLSLNLANNCIAFNYGCEFSPDGTKLYATSYTTLHQWDLCSGSNAAILASLYTQPTSQIWSLQLGPDGKIYASPANGSLDAITAPNLSGSAMAYSVAYISLSPNQSEMGLPNFVTSNLKPPAIPFTFTVSNTYGCQAAAFTPPHL